MKYKINGRLVEELIKEVQMNDAIPETLRLQRKFMVSMDKKTAILLSLLVKWENGGKPSDIFGEMVQMYAEKKGIKIEEIAP